MQTATQGYAFDRAGQNPRQDFTTLFNCRNPQLNRAAVFGWRAPCCAARQKVVTVLMTGYKSFQESCAKDPRHMREWRASADKDQCHLACFR
jgi:hypothetical protein